MRNIICSHLICGQIALHQIPYNHGLDHEDFNLPYRGQNLMAMIVQVPKLKEQFSPYGDLLKVQLDDVGPIEGGVDPKTSEVSACIYFTTRHAAEKAFLSGKSWKGHNLKFVWLNLSNTKKDHVNKEASSPTSNGSSVSSTDPGVETSKSISQEPSISGDGESYKTQGSEVVKAPTYSDESHRINCTLDE